MKYMRLALTAAFILTGCTGPVQTADRGPAAKMVVDASGYAYDPADRSCDGFPRLMVETMPGTCLGMVIPKHQEFKMLRTMLSVPGTQDMLLVDMGGWAPNNGVIYLLHTTGGLYDVTAIKTHLNMPHGFRLGSDGYYYIGETHQISRFHYLKGQITDWQLVFRYPDRDKGYMHPLMQFAFDPVSHDILINSGAPSDHCYNKPEFDSRCPETDMKGFAGLFQIPGSRLADIPPQGIFNYVQAAVGLRNSMALVIHESGTVIQGENGRDFSELEEPYEEINVINVIGDAAKMTPEGPEHPRDLQALNFGWPYCYDNFATSPEWLYPENQNSPMAQKFTTPLKCKLTAGEIDAIDQSDGTGNYHPPHALIPPHAAPLHADYYRGQMFPSLKGKLLMTWHGYQPTGHRLVAYPVDGKGRPVVTRDPAELAKATYSFDQPSGCAIRKSFAPREGMFQHAAYTEVISHWNEVKGVRPQGAPVSFTEAPDGSLWIAEDRKNNTVLRLARSDSAGYHEDCTHPQADLPDPRIELLAWRRVMNENPASAALYAKVQSGLISKYCIGCHGDMKADDINKNDKYANLDFLMKNQFVKAHDIPGSKMNSAIIHNGEYPAMPPGEKQFFGTKEGEDITRNLQDWIASLPTDIEARYKKFTIPVTTSLRAQPKSAKKCGAYQAKDVVYVDPRPETTLPDGSFTWYRTYLLPNDSRLFMGPDACPYPTDGVFYIPVKR